MANQKTVKDLQAITKSTVEPGAKALQVGDLIRAVQATDGTVKVKEALSTLKLVDVADVDLLLTFANGDHVIIPNGALDALGVNPPNADFLDATINLSELFKLVGVANPAKAGSLRLVSENIDANPPSENAEPQTEHIPDIAPPAPMVKVGAGTSSGSGKGPGNGVGAGEGEGDVPATVVPLATSQPSVYRVGKTTQSVQDLLDGTGLGVPNVTSELYTSAQFKVTPSGRVDLPLGAYDSTASTDQLADRASPAGQSAQEVINGTTSNDTIIFNSAFSAGVGQWSKSLHVTLNNFSEVNSIQLIFNAAKIADIPGFNLQGVGVTRDGPTSNSWHVTSDAAMLLNGLDVALVYDVDDSAAPVDFGADVIVNGKAGPFEFEVVNNLNFTWRDAVTQADFTVTSSTGDPLMVLPRAGVGVEVFAGAGNDTIHAGAGPDLIHGGDGDDNIYAGTGNDVIDGGLGEDTMDGEQGIDAATYQNAASAVTANLDLSLAPLGVVNTGEATNDKYDNIENLIGSNFDDVLIGDAQKNELKGGMGNDKLIGRGNSDILDGGIGNDTASYEYATSDVIVNLSTNKGAQSEASGDTLISIENIIGGAGNDAFISGLGVQANTYDGRIGSDTVSYETSVAASGVAATLTTGLSVVQTNEAAGDAFTNIENLTGASFADTLIGNGANNILNGGIGNGNDTLEGLAGADTFIGGGGSDTVSFEHTGLAVAGTATSALGAGVTASIIDTNLLTSGPAVTQTGDANGDFYDSIENLNGSNFNDVLIGDNTANILAGGDGDDVLEGLGGDDTLNGGNGTDTASYEHSVTGIAASLTTGLVGFISGGDAASDTYSSIENLRGSKFNDSMVGNSGINTLDGGDGDDVLEGMGGADTLNGGLLGINTASYVHSADQGGGLGVTASLAAPATNTGDAFNDTYINIQNLTGSAFNDTLTGDANNNTVMGGSGDDVITGGLGVDKLYGEGGNDQLVDDLVGATILDGGSGDDVITFTAYDGPLALDNIYGGDGTDTIVVNFAGSNYWNFDMKASANQTGGAIQNNWGAVFANFFGIENISVTGNNYLYVIVNNADNVITGGSTGSDYVDYKYALGGVKVNISGLAYTIPTSPAGIPGAGTTLAAQSATGGSGNDKLVNIDHIYAGSAFDDVLVGDANSNWIRGWTGNDVIDGGAGIDTWYIDWNGNSVTASLMTTAQNAALGIVMAGDAAGDTVLNMENIYSSYGDNLYGSGVANDLYGRGLIEGFVGADNIRGAGSNATASYANAGNAYLADPLQGVTTGAGIGVTASLNTNWTTGAVGPAVINTGDAAGDTYVNINNLTGSAFNDVLIGNNLLNTITGGAGDDVLEGLGGYDVAQSKGDTFDGGTGSDTVSYIHSTVGVAASLDSSVTKTNDALGDGYSGIENLTGTNFNDTLVGDGNDNILDGGLGINILNGSGHSVSGGDTASYLSATGALLIDLANNKVTGAGRDDTLINIERVIGSKYADNIIGTSLDDWIDGGEDSVSGADTINAGNGNDTISYANAIGGRTVVLNSSSTDGKILSNFENILGSSSGDSLTGDSFSNKIEGGLGDDTLNGGTGAGIDTVSYQYATAAVSVNISNAVVLSIATNAAAGGEGSDSLSNFESITGSAYNDTLVGDGSANEMNGGDGNDILVGGADADKLNGGAGVDTASYVNALGAVTVTINGTGTLGDANGDTLTGIENLVGSSFDDTLYGDNADNVIDGGAGEDIINANGGVDTIAYLAASAAVSVNLGNAGKNAYIGLVGDTLTNFENIVGSIFNDTLIGDGGNNKIEGGLGNDTLNGGAGVGIDTVSYETASSGVSVNISGFSVSGVAANTATGGAGNDSVIGFESIAGSAFNDTLIGDLNSNVINGGAGNDLLIGGAGGDVFTGGVGVDTATYVNATSAVRATLGGAALAHLGDALGDTLTEIENLTGSTFDDILYGDIYNNTLIGGAGNDDLRGYAGNDVIDATQGLDQIYGGDGDDTITVSATSIGAAAQYRGEANTSTAFGGGDTIKLTGLVSGGYTFNTLANETDSMEILDIRDAISTSLSITSLDVRNFVDGGNGSNMWIKANSGDVFNFTAVAGETLQSFNVANGVDYVVFDTNINAQVAAIHWQTA